MDPRPAVLKSGTLSAQKGAANGRTTRSVLNLGSRAQTETTFSEGSPQLRNALPNPLRGRLAPQTNGFRRRLRFTGGYQLDGKMPPMTHDWLLVETLGSEPAVVAQGGRTKNLVPISAFLRRNPNLMAIQTAIGETVRAGVGLSSITPKNDRVIRTEVVQMSDGRIHGVHVWVGPPNLEPPERPIPGPLKWDLSRGVATDTPESL